MIMEQLVNPGEIPLYYVTITNLKCLKAAVLIIKVTINSVEID